jgi:hypothetical protein
MTDADGRGERISVAAALLGVADETLRFDESIGKYMLWCVLVHLQRRRTARIELFHKVVRRAGFASDAVLYRFTCGFGVVVFSTEPSGRHAVANLLLPRSVDLSVPLLCAFCEQFADHGERTLSLLPLLAQIPPDDDILRVVVLRRCRLLRSKRDLARLRFDAKRGRAYLAGQPCRWAPAEEISRERIGIDGALPASRACDDDDHLVNDCWHAVPRPVARRSGAPAAARCVRLQNLRCTIERVDDLPVADDADAVRPTADGRLLPPRAAPGSAAAASLACVVERFAAGPPAQDRLLADMRAGADVVDAMAARFLFATSVRVHGITDTTIAMACTLRLRKPSSIVDSMQSVGRRLLRLSALSEHALAEFVVDLIGYAVNHDEWLKWAHASPCAACLLLRTPPSVLCLMLDHQGPGRQRTVCGLLNGLLEARGGGWTHDMMRLGHTLRLRGGASPEVEALLREWDDSAQRWEASELHAATVATAALAVAADAGAGGAADGAPGDDAADDDHDAAPDDADDDRDAAPGDAGDAGEDVPDATHHGRAARIADALGLPRSDVHLIGSGHFFEARDVDLVVEVEAGGGEAGEEGPEATFAAARRRVAAAGGWSAPASTGDTVCPIDGVFEGFAVELQVVRRGVADSERTVAETRAAAAVELTRRIVDHTAPSVHPLIRDFHRWADAAGAKGHACCRLSGIACTVLCIALGTQRGASPARDVRAVLRRLDDVLRAPVPLVELVDDVPAAASDEAAADAPLAAPLCVVAHGRHLCERMTLKTTRLLGHLVRAAVAARDAELFDPAYYDAQRAAAGVVRVASVRVPAAGAVHREWARAAKLLDGKELVHAVHAEWERPGDDGDGDGGGGVLHVGVSVDGTLDPRRFGLQAFDAAGDTISVAAGAVVVRRGRGRRALQLVATTRPRPPATVVPLAALRDGAPCAVNAWIELDADAAERYVLNAPNLVREVHAVFHAPAWGERRVPVGEIGESRGAR